MKTLLILYHSQSGRNRKLALAAAEAARGALDTAETVSVRLCRASEAGTADLLEASLLLVVTPENLGSLAGGMKDFFDRTYYPAQGKVEGLPFAVVINCGNDGTGALRQLRSIAKGYGMKEAAEPLITKGPPDAAALEAAGELGAALSAGLEMGIY